MKINQTIITFIAITGLASPFGFAKSPESKPDKAKIEVCFVLDTTGSMGGLIQGAKEKIWTIANEIIDTKPTPELSIGLIGYRDRTDDYITKTYPLTDDIDAIYGDLLGFQAGGGGDSPESVNQALHEAVTKMEWSKSKDVLKIIFLVGDAPPHMDYENDVRYPEVCRLAMKRDLIINTIQCGTNHATTPIWQEIASKSEGDYAAILQNGGTIAISTPFDAEIAELNRTLNSTVCGYGNESERQSVRLKLANNEMASPEATASRASFLTKQKAEGDAFAKQIGGDEDLIALIAEDKLNREDIDPAKLPEEVAKMKPEQRNSWIDQKLADRKSAQEKLTQLLKQREDVVTAKKAALAKEGKGDGFDAQVSKSLRKQAAKKGIIYQ